MQFSISTALLALVAFGSAAIIDNEGVRNVGRDLIEVASEEHEVLERRQGGNLQTFTGSLGGAAPPVTNTGGQRPFTVNGNTFTTAKAAITRSCDIQNNQCFNAVNGGRLSGGTQQCQQQQQQCIASASLAKRAAPRTFADNNGRTIANGGCCNHGVNLRQDICNNGGPGRCIPAASTREGCVGLTCVVNTKLTCDPTKQDRGRDLCTLIPGQ